MQDTSGTDFVLGRSTAGAGTVEEIACTAAGRALLDDADAGAQRTTLGLGTMAVETATDYIIAAGTTAFSGDQSMGDNDITNAQTVTFGADPDTQTTASTTLTLDFSSGQKHRVTLDRDITTVTPTDPVGCGNFVVEFVQDGTGLWDVSGWAANVHWAGGVAPVFGDAAAATRIVSFYYNGTTDDEYFGSFDDRTYS